MTPTEQALAVGLPVESKTYDVYRITSRKPGKRKFEYLGFSGATKSTLDEARTRLGQAIEETHDTRWRFRIERRTVTVLTTPWEVEV